MVWEGFDGSYRELDWGELQEDSEEVFGGEWFHTKDAARQDEDGYIWYEGRADDVIIAAGYRVGPFEVESVCLKHPAVRDEPAAVASPDELRGNVVKAFIVLAADHEPSDELADELKAFVRERCPIRVSAPGRVRRGPAQDADEEDPPHRAPPAGARTGGGRARLIPGELELAEPLREEASLGVRGDELERPLVGGAGVLDTTEPAQQLGPRGVEVVVAIEVEAVDQR
jgi:acyl-CoA synthetase (AMP-forming)/AMP-acid ligase II